MLQVTVYSLEVTGYSLQVTAYSLQATGYNLQVTGYSLQVTGWRPLRQHRMMSTEWVMRRVASGLEPEQGSAGANL